MIAKLRGILGGNLSILWNAGSLVGANAVTSILGFAYWWIAARHFPADAVGFSAAAISAMMLLGYVSMFGMGTLIIRELPLRKGGEHSLISTGLLVSGAAGVLCGIIFALLGRGISSEFAALDMDLFTALIFAAGVSLTGITLVLDQALVGLLRGGLQLGRNAIFAGSKLVFLLAIGLWWADTSWLPIYATWMLGNLISLSILLFLRHRNRSKRRAILPDWSMMRGLGKAAISHHFLNLASLAPSQALPVIVTIMISSEANAYFYMAWMVSSIVFVGTASLSTALYAVGSRTPEAMAQRTRFTLAMSLVIAVAAGGVLAVAAGPILGLFGVEYAEEASWSLRLLVLAALPQGIKAHYSVIWRIRGELLRPGLWVAAGGLLELTLAALGAVLGGLTGLSIGWAAATFIEAGLMSRTVVGVATGKHRFPCENSLEGGAEDRAPYETELTTSL